MTELMIILWQIVRFFCNLAPGSLKILWGSYELQQWGTVVNPNEYDHLSCQLLFRGWPYNPSNRLSPSTTTVTSTNHFRTAQGHLCACKKKSVTNGSLLLLQGQTMSHSQHLTAFS